MKKIILAGLAAATLASCSQESTMDVAITSTKIPISYSAYAGSATTKGNPVDSNTEFKDEVGTFEVSAYTNTDADNTLIGKYFDFSTVTYGTGKWENTDKMYYPNVDTKIFFGAYAPSAAVGLGTPEYTHGAAATDPHSLTIPYTVRGDYPTSGAKTVSDMDDLMYAVTEFAYTAPTKDESDDDATIDDGKVNLHFKHALTQVAFTATKDPALDVTVRSITLCNILNSGTFTASEKTDYSGTLTSDQTTEDANVTVADMGSWTSMGSVYNHYTAAIDGTVAGKVTAVTGAVTPTKLTDDDNALMLIPQEVTPWTYLDTPGSTGTVGSTASVAGDNTSYLAINCKVSHTGSTEPIIDGIVYVKFSSEGITYTATDSDSISPSFADTYKDKWAPGYKVTYNLNFGGGYTDPTPGTTPTIPDPGTTPDPDDLVPTLRPITYTTSVDEWKTTATAPGVAL